MLGLDFGTTNSAIAVARPGEAPRLAAFDDGASTFRSILHVDPEDAGEGGLPPRITAGASAIRTWVETGGRGRLIQSIKSHLASRLFTATDLFGRRYRLEDLIAIVLRDLASRRARRSSASTWRRRRSSSGGRCGLRRARAADDEAFALGRLEAALRQAGFGPVTFELEPVAAALGLPRAPGARRAGPDRRLRRRHQRLLAGAPGCRRRRRSSGVDGVARRRRRLRRAAHPARRRAGAWPRLPAAHGVRPGAAGPAAGSTTSVERWEELSFLKSRETTELLRRLRAGGARAREDRGARAPGGGRPRLRAARGDRGAKQVLSRDDTARFRFDDGPIDAGAPGRAAATSTAGSRPS